MSHLIWTLNFSELHPFGYRNIKKVLVHYDSNISMFLSWHKNILNLSNYRQNYLISHVNIDLDSGLNAIS